MKMGWKSRGRCKLNVSSLANIIFKLESKLAMSSRIILDNISFGNNPAMFQDNIELDITFTAITVIPEML